MTVSTKPAGGPRAITTDDDAAEVVRTARPEPGVAMLTLDMPATRNSLSRRMIAALDAAFPIGLDRSPRSRSR